MRTISLPFRFEGGEVSHTSDPETVVRQRIVSYLTTSSSERFNLPDFGFNLSELLFEPIDELVQSDIKTDLLPGLQQYVTGANILDIRIEQDPIDISIADVFVTYSLPLSPARTFAFSVANDLTEESAL